MPDSNFESPFFTKNADGVRYGPGGNLGQWSSRIAGEAAPIIIGGVSGGSPKFNTIGELGGSNLPMSASRGINGYRYMTDGELQAIKETGLLRGGWEGETYFTKDLYKSAAKAQNRLSLGSRPTLRVEFQIISNPKLLRNGTKVGADFGMTGKGAEFMTLDRVKVKLINWQPLR